jgi:hypothetical protein
MSDHSTGNPELIHQHKVIQRQGDQELNGAEPKGEPLPGDAELEERVAGVVIPDNRSQTHLSKMKASADQEIDGEAGGAGSTGAGANPGP